MHMFVGGYSWAETPARGLSVIGDGGLVRSFTEIPQPFHCTLSPSGHTLYVASNVPEGRIHAVTVSADGTLIERASQPAEGAGTVHTLVHDGHLFATNHDSGEVVVFPLGEDESPGPVCQVIRHTGSGPNSLSQQGPHPHMTLPDPTGSRLLVPDKGTDWLHVYRWDGARLSPHSQVHLGSGHGPRQAVFHPGGRHLYVVNELVSSVTICGYEPASGALWTCGAAATLPEGADGWNAPSAILLSPGGEHLYVANRGHESIAVLEVKDGGAVLEPAGWLRLGEEPLSVMPWDLAWDPAGRLNVANQTAGTVLPLPVDPATGLPELSDAAIKVPDAAFLLFG
ncbi:lactonase family protein [Nonomuraea jabiensis]|uniref:6-phosphogluconolactonase (Cycloisomerase 2 family) n=1 Tax=Nonomuraea jabiensis TaxID=882448 RepID=A0A7W9GD90_9ACTN|nr:beta-propeller fold lactonase family protein [Nonomuraea jabiensis]MBB5781683.1 6-phosphogluconolactonase (cycloisomerase 2 family) [Nonomuraea jabiensis]